MTGWLIDINPRECPPDVMDAPEAYRAGQLVQAGP